MDRAVVLRLAGIYGPGRVPYVELLRAGDPIAAPRLGWLNLIHVEDAASATIAAADHADPPSIVCVADGKPPQRGDYYAEASKILGAAEPRFTEPPPDSPRAARAAANKRVRNLLLRGRLGVELAYPTYREGLADALA